MVRNVFLPSFFLLLTFCGTSNEVVKKTTSVTSVFHHAESNLDIEKTISNQIVDPQSGTRVADLKMCFSSDGEPLALRRVTSWSCHMACCGTRLNDPQHPRVKNNSCVTFTRLRFPSSGTWNFELELETTDGQVFALNQAESSPIAFELN